MSDFTKSIEDIFRACYDSTTNSLQVSATNGVFYPEVATFGDLPAAASYTGRIYVVRTGSGTYLVSRKSAGLYRSDGVNWTRLGNIPAYFDSGNLKIYDTSDNTKEMNFDLSNIATGTVVTLTSPTASGTIALTNQDNSFSADQSFGDNAITDIATSNITNMLATTMTVTATSILATATGNVGIGTISPPAKLSIDNGNINDANKILLYGLSTATSVAYSIGTESGGGIVYNVDAADSNHFHDFRFAGSTNFRIRGDGNVGIGTTVPGCNIHVYGSGDQEARIESSSSGNAKLRLLPVGGGIGNVAVYNSLLYLETETEHNVEIRPNSTTKLKVETDGGIFAASLLGSTGGSDARYDTSSKEIFYDTSSIRYKENITDEVDIDWLYQIPVKKYDRKDGSKTGEIGIIAEDLEAINPALVCYDCTNYKEIEEAKTLKEHDSKVVIPEQITRVESYSKSDLIPSLLKAIQIQKAQIDDLTSRIAALEKA